MKRVMIVTLALLLLAAFFPAAGQAETLLTSGDFEYHVLEDGTAEITRYKGSAKSLEIPGKLNGLAVTGIGDRAFYECWELASISIPDSVISTGYNPFADCKNLNRVTVHPDHPAFATIDGVLFNKADKHLIWYPMPREDTVYEIPQGIQSIGEMAFFGCENLTSISIPDSVTSIGDLAFSGCKNLTSISIPDSVTSIGDSAFCWCSSLKEITIPDSVTSIGDSAFFGCENLTSISIPDSVTSIGVRAFYRCKNLTSISIPDSVTSIGDEAFCRCSSLKEITIPDSVANLGYNPFEYCKNLNRVTVHPDHPVLATIDGVLFNKADKRLIWYPIPREDTVYEIPQGIQSIGDRAFYDCSSFKEITIPDSVTSIGDLAFYMCENLISITIPDSVTSIGDGAFAGCSSLQKVIVAPDSYAQKYCEERGLPFVFHENTDWLNQ